MNQNTTRRGAALKSLCAAAATTAVLFAAGTAQAETIKIGYISPLTGSHAEFSETDPFVLKKMNALLKSGLTINGKKYDVRIISKDSQSSNDRASSLAAQLILKDKVDLLLVQDSLSSITAADQAELYGVPAVSTMMPWQAWMFPRKGDPKVGFKWTYHFFWGLEDVIAAYVDIWSSVPTNKTVGAIYSKDPGGEAFGSEEFGMPVALKKIGYKEVKTGFFQEGAADFSPQIGKFKAEHVDIVTGHSHVPDFTTFWSQSGQQKYRPKVVTMAAALLFPSGLKSLGDRGDGLTTEVWWAPGFPYKSSLTGQTAKELAAQYESETGRQWTQPLGYAHAIWEVGVEALKRSGNPHDRKAVSKALSEMKMKTIVGTVNWADTPIKNVAKTTVVGGQWRKSKGKHKFELLVTNNASAPDIPVQDKVKLLD
ncbi:MAG TPA: ABC transporter substrate-binding protein [Paucimonas sp.]|nr:ABC transporter substrate-binding protein [Paucimonas sp.]HJW55992.1 ABC transporter substrate-binding protein [Burkholderiaceae bacterium]